MEPSKKVGKPGAATHFGLYVIEMLTSLQFRAVDTAVKGYLRFLHLGWPKTKVYTTYSSRRGWDLLGGPSSSHCPSPLTSLPRNRAGDLRPFRHDESGKGGIDENSLDLDDLDT